MNPSLESFREAFSPPFATCRRQCECGLTYYDSYNRGYSWDEGELEELEVDPKAVSVDGSVGTVEFEGRHFVWNCTCWHARAEKLITFLNSHAGEIADYLTREKRRKQAEADASPTVEEITA